MTCIDCHGTGATHGRGRILSRMKIQTHENDVLCETCHGDLDNYAVNNGDFVLNNAGEELKHILVNGDGIGTNSEFFLISKYSGGTHYIPQVKDIIDGTRQATNVKIYPAGSPRAGQPVFSWVGSAAMGRFDRQNNLIDGLGPEQITNNDLYLAQTAGFSHVSTPEQPALECYTCHASWQNNCVGCHLDAFYDVNANNFFYSQITGRRVFMNFNANFVYQNPIEFYMGVNDRGRISPYQGLHRFFQYTDLNNNTSNRISHSDRRGMGNDPALRNPNRNNLPALQSQPFTPHSIRGRWTQQAVGGRGCLDCHLGDNNALTVWNENRQDFDFTNEYANEYLADGILQTAMAQGWVENIHLFDADGNAVFDTNNAAVYDLSRNVEFADGTSNISGNHPYLARRAGSDPQRGLLPDCGPERDRHRPSPYLHRAEHDAPEASEPVHQRSDRCVRDV